MVWDGKFPLTGFSKPCIHETEALPGADPEYAIHTYMDQIGAKAPMPKVTK